MSNQAVSDVSKACQFTSTSGKYYLTISVENEWMRRLISPNDWIGYKQPFFGFLGNPMVCLATYCFGPCVVGYALGGMEKKGFHVVGCLCSGLGAYELRKGVQAKYGIQEDSSATMCGVGLCGSCAVCQDVNELAAHGELPLFAPKAAAKTVQPAEAPEMKAAPSE